MVSPADAELLRRAQGGIRALVERDLRGFFGMLNLSQPERSRDLLLAFVPELVRRYGMDAAQFAAEWYDVQRAAAGVSGAYRATALASPYLAATEPTVRRAAGALFTDTPADALTTLLAATGKYVLAAPRDTIARATDRDPQAVGWKRITRPGACSFCRMLAGRGAVYREATAHFASHGSCNCAAAPSWDADAPEVDVRLYDASQRTTGMSPQQRERHNALIQRAIGDYAD
ncbi:hypothetical protein [Cellulomonas shaoxiangyii]|uniref:MuF-like minor capsid protein n=1 Tax=Cellulomonas shaoxiangyii TaxID=2566013 RepID=A0A4P7SJM1_9CELL|nr:hypothetical protein [Cellulomonas shaoxiangyii]QCB93306.1 hypothetical protein E5225_06825 [Cellulomonas shaoxiangyii]TGY82475.1 hypothetical protein E5226_13125 [Cellulomonas shaoxiangyii]